MELWIRSQNKGGLIRVEILGNTDGIIHSYSGVNKIVLGKYSSDKRALEVLDEIQSKIKQQFIVKPSVLMTLKDIDREENRLTWKYDKEFIMQDNGFEIVPINDGAIVYEMPEK